MHQKTMEVSQNHIVILVCQASGFPIPNVNLQRINTLYEWESLSNQPHINESESLWWYELNEYSDRDAYRCLANNTFDEFATSEVVVLSVIGQLENSFLHYDDFFIIFRVYTTCVCSVYTTTHWVVRYLDQPFVYCWLYVIWLLAKYKFHVRWRITLFCLLWLRQNKHACSWYKL